MKKHSLHSLGLAVAAGCLAIATPAAAQNNALEFNGLSDFVLLTTSSATNMLKGYTLEAWALSTTSTAPHRILSNFQQTPNRGFGFGVRGTNWRHTTFAIKDYDTATDTMTTGVWTHIAVTLDNNNTATFYKNGQFLATITHGVGARESTHTLNIGRNPTGTEYWQGKLDEIRIWNTVRTPTEIANNWNRTLDGDEADLIGYYPFNEGSGTTTADGSPVGSDGDLIGCTWTTGPDLLAPYTNADSRWLQQP